MCLIVNNFYHQDFISKGQVEREGEWDEEDWGRKINDSLVTTSDGEKVRDSFLLLHSVSSYPVKVEIGSIINLYRVFFALDLGKEQAGGER